MLFMEAVEKGKDGINEHKGGLERYPLTDRTYMTEGDFAGKPPCSASTDHIGPFLSII